MADGVGFEPTMGDNPCRFSRPVHSTTLPPIRNCCLLGRAYLVFLCYANAQRRTAQANKTVNTIVLTIWQTLCQHDFIGVTDVGRTMTTQSNQHNRDDWAAALATGDYQRAITLLRPLAERGDAAAQFELAQMYESGQGVALDDGLAAHWYRLAAQQGHSKAQFYLGQIYANGQGQGQSQQLTQAQGISQLNPSDSGVGKDYIAAYIWWTRASQQGHEGATSGLRFLTRVMDNSQLAQAKQQLVVETDSDN